jgi:hypothetical protein
MNGGPPFGDRKRQRNARDKIKTEQTETPKLRDSCTGAPRRLPSDQRPCHRHSNILFPARFQPPLLGVHWDVIGRATSSRNPPQPSRQDLKFPPRPNRSWSRQGSGVERLPPLVRPAVGILRDLLSSPSHQSTGPGCQGSMSTRMMRARRFWLRLPASPWATVLGLRWLHLAQHSRSRPILGSRLIICPRHHEI